MCLSKIFVFIVIIAVLNLSGYPEDFSFLKPPYTFYQREQNINVSGQDMKAYVFQTTLTEAEIINFYDKSLKDKGFTKVSKEFSQAGFRFSSYVKAGQVINIQIMKSQGGFPAVTVIVSVYNQLSSGSIQGCPTCEGGDYSESALASVPEATAQDFGSITKDLPGEDLEFIPRPQGSVRIANFKNDNPSPLIIIVYKCNQSLEALKNFYKQNMDYHYWKLAAEFSSSQLEAEFKNLTEKIPKGAPVSLDTLKSAYNLYFKGPYGEAIIVIMENLQGEGRLVSISYRKK